MTAHEQERADLDRKARFCLVTGIAPSEYDAMTDQEVEAFTEAWNDLQQQHHTL